MAGQIDALLVSAKWPQGRSVEQALLDVEAVLKLMSAKLSNTRSAPASMPTRPIRARTSSLAALNRRR